MLECMRFFLNFVPRAIEEENYIKKEYDPESRFRFIRLPPSSFQLLWRIALFLLRLMFYDRIRNKGYRISKYIVFGVCNDESHEKYNISE